MIFIEMAPILLYVTFRPYLNTIYCVHGGRSPQSNTVYLKWAKTFKNYNIHYLMIVLQWFYSSIYETIIGISRFYFFH